MELTFALLADYANVSQEGKLNVLGLFNRILVQKFPAHHPQMHLVLRFLAGAGEYGRTRGVTIKLITEDGKEVFSLPQNIAIGEGGGRPLEINRILVMNNVVFSGPGEYSFRIVVDDDEKGSVPVTLALKSGD